METPREKGSGCSKSVNMDRREQKTPFHPRSPSHFCPPTDPILLPSSPGPLLTQSICISLPLGCHSDFGNHTMFSLTRCQTQITAKIHMSELAEEESRQRQRIGGDCSAIHGAAVQGRWRSDPNFAASGCPKHSRVARVGLREVNNSQVSLCWKMGTPDQSLV